MTNEPLTPPVRLDLDALRVPQPTKDREPTRPPFVSATLTPDDVWSAARKIGEWVEECDFDHHGYCQAHFLAEPPCPFGVLRGWANWP